MQNVDFATLMVFNPDLQALVRLEQFAESHLIIFVNDLSSQGLNVTIIQVILRHDALAKFTEYLGNLSPEVSTRNAIKKLVQRKVISLTESQGVLPVELINHGVMWSYMLQRAFTNVELIVLRNHLAKFYQQLPND